MQGVTCLYFCYVRGTQVACDHCAVEVTVEQSNGSRNPPEPPRLQVFIRGRAPFPRIGFLMYRKYQYHNVWPEFLLRVVGVKLNAVNEALLWSPCVWALSHDVNLNSDRQVSTKVLFVLELPGQSVF